jgi:hypothetical protein
MSVTATRRRGLRPSGSDHPAQPRDGGDGARAASRRYGEVGVRRRCWLLAPPPAAHPIRPAGGLRDGALRNWPAGIVGAKRAMATRRRGLRASGSDHPARNRATGAHAHGRRVGVPVKWPGDDVAGRGHPLGDAHPHPPAGGRDDGRRAVGRSVMATRRPVHWAAKVGGPVETACRVDDQMRMGLAPRGARCAGRM